MPLTFYTCDNIDMGTEINSDGLQLAQRLKSAAKKLFYDK